MKLNTGVLSAILVWFGTTACWSSAAAGDAAVARRAEWRNIQRQNPALVPYYQEAARQLGLGEVNADTFSKLAPEVAGSLKQKANALHQGAIAQRLNNLQADRNAAREQNIPLALATAHRLQWEGRQKLAQAGGLQEADPEKAILEVQGQKILDEGKAQAAGVMNAWQQQTNDQMRRQLLQAAPMFGPQGAGIVATYVRGEAEIQRQKLAIDGRIQRQQLENKSQTARRGGAHDGGNGVIQSHVEGEFNGWDGNTLVKLRNGQVWLQDEYTYEYHYRYCPEVNVFNTETGFKMSVEGVTKDVKVRRLEDVTDGKIFDDFTGWDGNTIVKLANGQVWKQDDFQLETRIRIMPDVLIYRDGAGYFMKVEGSNRTVRVIQLQ